jgi:hypothetical protein
MKLNNVTFIQICDLLNATTNGMDEAFEFRWLREIGPIDPEVRVLADQKEKMIRCTFPFQTEDGRGRIWLKRHYREIDKRDIAKLLEIARYLSIHLQIPINSHPNTDSFISRFVSVEELLNITCLSDIK